MTSKVEAALGRDKIESFTLEQLAAEWQNNEHNKKAVHDEMMKQVVLQRLSQITGLINADCDRPSGTSDHGPISSVNWDEVYEVSANVMDLYTKEIDECLAELDRSYRRQYLWQEAAFTIDSHRGATRIGVAESWIVGKEGNLEFTRQELSTSARVIKKTLEELSRK
ncbi:LADA_0H14708g1_1 [Lachancea dasiensis]|uniref:LADA_0H14708g1_1 n=1 Tax=Lachancea dasiensis TaxID=1072105 RepID=A0A1G4K4K0_9SACH|nr:LADA_0H14708g1_1 [Lachancea dasiensis]